MSTEISQQTDDISKMSNTSSHVIDSVRAYLTSVKQIHLSDGLLEDFNPARFERSIRYAFNLTGFASEKDEPVILHVTDEAIAKLTLLFDGRMIPDTVELGEIIVEILLDHNLPLVAKSYIEIIKSSSLSKGAFLVDKPKFLGNGHQRNVLPNAVRRRLPDERSSITHTFQIGPHKGCLTVSLYEDGSPGEIFISMSEDGSTIAGLLDALATSVSIGLQFGIPLRTLVEKFSHVHFDPSGFTENLNIRTAESIVDYIFRWLGSEFSETMSSRTIIDDNKGEVAISESSDVERLLGSCRIMTPRKVYKPFEYEHYFEYFTKQNQAHWMPIEVNMESDISDYKYKLTKEEIGLIINILRFFTQGDIEVNNNYNSRLIPFFPKPEIKMMLSAFAATEGIHIWAYSYLNDSLGLPDEEYSAFLNIKAMREKYDYLQNFDVRSIEELAINLAVFGGFMEGVSLFSSFAILMNFPRLGRLKGVGQIITWSIRDESLHSLGVCHLFRDLVSENHYIWTPELQNTLYSACKDMISLEDAFIDACFSLGDVAGLKADEVKQYIRYTADRKLNELGLDHLYKVNKNPLQWLDVMINAKEHANFFENRATEYSKGAVINDWT